MPQDRSPDPAGDASGEVLQDAITCRMAVRVIDRLEVINIQHDQGKTLAFIVHAVQQQLKVLVKIALLCSPVSVSVMAMAIEFSTS